nr:hypothetical protein [Ktedonobacter sp. SOSP1-52]
MARREPRRDASHPFTQPDRGRLPLKPRGRRNLQKGQDRADAQALIHPPGLKSQQRQGRIQLLKLPVDQAHRARALPLQPLTQPQLFYGPNGRGVRTKDMVIELIQPRLANAKARRQATRHRLLLKEHYRMSRLHQAVRRHQTQRPAAKDRVFHTFFSPGYKIISTYAPSLPYPALF